MGIELIAAASLATTAYSVVEQRAARADAAEAQEKQRQEVRAQNAAQAARERREQIRAERVRRAQVIQASANTGVTASSGESAAVGAAGSQLSQNLGFNAGMISSADRQSNYAQQAEDAMFDYQQWGQIGALGTNIFQMSGGFNAFRTVTQTPAPVSTAVTRNVG